MNWSGPALAAAAAAALCCLVAALLAPTGHLFAALLAAGLGIAAVTAYSAFALRDAERRIAKLSHELTVVSKHLLKLESRIEPPQAEATLSLTKHVETLNQATSALADVLDGQDARLRALEQKDARAAPPPAPPAIEAPTPLVPPTAEIGPPRTGPLRTREDFARAASVILDRLAPDPLRIVETPDDDRIVDELEAGRAELWLQPVVSLPQRRLRLYAGLPHLRGRDGAPLGPEIIGPILARRRRMERLDAFTLSQGLVVASHLARQGRETAVVVALSRPSLRHETFLAGAASRLEGSREATSRLVLEIAHEDAETLSTPEAAILARFRGLGATLAISGAPSLDQDWAALARRGFSFAMLDVGTLLAPRPHATTAFLVAEAARAGVTLVATGVEREPQIPDLLDFDVPLARGQVLAPARPVRADVLAPPAEPAEKTAAPAAAPSQPEGRTSFREFLRRAG